MSNARKLLYQTTVARKLQSAHLTDKTQNNSSNAQRTCQLEVTCACELREQLYSAFCQYGNFKPN